MGEKNSLYLQPLEFGIEKFMKLIYLFEGELHGKKVQRNRQKMSKGREQEIDKAGIRFACNPHYKMHGE